ncbi:MAG: dCTP deaminase [Acidimicrobiales bacterium]
MVLSDGTLRRFIAEGRLGLAPFDPDLVQPGSVDVRLDRRFRVFRNSHTAVCIDPYDLADDLTEQVTVAEGEAFILHPGEFALGSTLEVVRLPADVVARVEGKSSLGRLGILIHASAGWLDAGFEGAVTLELSNVSPLPVKLWPGMRIGQFSFMLLDRPAERPYGHPTLGSKYQHQEGPVESHYRPDAAR